MPLKEASPLLVPLVTSLALHALSFALMASFYGGVTGSDSRGYAAAQRSGMLRITLFDKRPATTDTIPSKVASSPAAAAQAPLPEGLISLPGPYYFPPQELSRKPQTVAPIPLEYPENAPPVARNHVVLRLLISEIGNVDRIIVETADVPKELEFLARQAFANAKFQPGLRGDTPVKSQMLVEITFEGENSPPPPGILLPTR